MTKDLHVMYSRDGEPITGLVDLGKINVEKDTTKILYFRNSSAEFTADVSDIRFKDDFILEGPDIIKPQETAKFRVRFTKLKNSEDASNWPFENNKIIGTIKWTLPDVKFSQTELDEMK